MGIEINRSSNSKSIGRLASMSNNPNDYEYIKALVRGLHIQKNVARPHDAALLSPNMRNDEPDTTSNTEDDDDDYNGDDDDENTRLPTVDEGGSSAARRASDLRLSKHELARLRKQHKQTLRLNRKSLPQTQQPKLPIHHRSNHSLNIPSVVVTGASEHIDLLASTQRRFSQLYSGLRRFSTSHTVCCSIHTIFFRLVYFPVYCSYGLILFCYIGVQNACSNQLHMTYYDVAGLVWYDTHSHQPATAPVWS